MDRRGRLDQVAAGAFAVAVASLLSLGVEGGPGGGPPPGPLVLDDFDGHPLGPEWEVKGATLRLAAAGGGSALEVGGWSTGKGARATATLALPAVDLSKFGKLSFRYSCTEGPFDIALHLRTGAGPRMYWTFRKMEKGEGLTMEVPLSTMEDENKGLWMGAPGGVKSLQWAWEGASGTVLLDDIRLLPPGKGERGFRLGAADFLALGFDGGAGRAVESRSFTLLSDLPDMKGDKGPRLLAKLEEGVTMLGERFGLKGRLPEKGLVMVFRTMAMADVFTGRLEGVFGFEAGAPTPAGSAANQRKGIVLSWPADAGGPYLPALAHEALHPLVRQHLGISSNTWIQEGIVSSVHRRMYEEYYAAVSGKFRPVSAETFRRALKGEKCNLEPLVPFLAGKSFAFEDFVQLASIFDYLAVKHRASLPKVWEAVRALDVPVPEGGFRAVAGALGMTPEAFEKDWLQWGAANFK